MTLAIEAHFGWQAQQMGVQTAVLHGDIEE